jgi:hypothetical protein
MHRATSTSRGCGLCRLLRWALLLLGAAGMLWLQTRVASEGSGLQSLSDTLQVYAHSVQTFSDPALSTAAPAAPPSPPAAGKESAVSAGEAETEAERFAPLVKTHPATTPGPAPAAAAKGSEDGPSEKKTPPRVLAPMQAVQVSDDYRRVFDHHVSRGFPAGIPLDAYMRRTSRARQCRGKPLFVTMARVKSDLYWQLIENFFFTM